MLENFETQSTNAKHAVEDMAGRASASAHDMGGRVAKIARIAMRAMPLLPDQAIDFVLTRAGLVRKRSGLGAAALFTGGFVAGSVVTALTTPMTGADLRVRIKTSLRSSMASILDPETVSAGLETASEEEGSDAVSLNDNQQDQDRARRERAEQHGLS